MKSRKKVKLDVPLIKQKNPYDCSIASALMLCQFYNREINYDKFIVKRDELKRANIFELASSLKKYGKFNPCVTFFNYSFFDDINFPSQIKELAALDGIFSSIKQCIDEGILVKHKIFFIKDIENLILNNKPVLTLISVREFRKINLKKFKGHFIIITGFDSKYFYYNDPHWDDKKFGRHKIEKEQLMLSIYKTRFPAILWIK